MIGIGIDSDVTSAAGKAIRDVLDRNTHLDDFDKPLYNSQHRKLHIQLGVPLPASDSRHTDTSSKTTVDIELLLLQLFPNCHRQQALPSVNIQVGGLCVQSHNKECLSGGATCMTTIERKVVVASLSYVRVDEPIYDLNQTTTQVDVESPPQKQPVEEVENRPEEALGTTIVQMEIHHPSLTGQCHAITTKPTKHGFQTLALKPFDAEKRDLFPAANTTHDCTLVTANVDPSMDKAIIQKKQPTRRSFSSIDLLAHISASIIHKENRRGNDVSQEVNVPNDGYTDATINSTYQLATVKPSKNELPKTFKASKNPRRHFVRHSYQDLSHEIPQAICDEFGRRQISTRMLAFPLKLHTALNQIEVEQNDHIFGWLPHGRSFVMHNQHDFATIVLPQYFQMNKKSSFLRQINLYGFRRISDGSYYHERFLRGMKFICQSMQRQKVNGNCVRGAGNPDEEPNLWEYPICPPTSLRLPDLNHSSIEGRINSQSAPSMSEQFIESHEEACVHESVSSLDDDRAAQSGSTSLKSSDECNDDDMDESVHLVPVSPSCPQQRA